LALTVFGNLASTSFGINNCKAVTSLWRALKAENLNRLRRTSFLNLIATIVDQRTNTAPFLAENDNVTTAQRTLLNQNGCNGTTTAIQLGFDHDAFSGTIRIRTQFQNFGLQLQSFQKLVDASLLGRGNFYVQNFTAQGFHKHFVLEELSANLL